MAQLTNPMDFGTQGPQSAGPADAFQDPSALDDYGEDPGPRPEEMAPPPPPTVRGVDKESGFCPRRFTDIGGCLAFTAFMIFIGIVALIWHNDEDMERMRHGFDAEGRLCGVDEDVKDRPYLYYCRRDPLGSGTPASWRDIDLKRPACVATCPREGGDQVECLQESENTVEQPQAGAMGTSWINIVKSVQKVDLTAAYDTGLRSGMNCLPDNDDLRRGAFLHASPGTHWHYFRSAFGGLIKVWGVFAVVTCAALLIGYVFVIFYEFVRTIPIVLAALVLGLFLLGVAIFLMLAFIIGGIFEVEKYMEDMNPFYPRVDKWVAATVSTLVGLVLLAQAAKLLWLAFKLFRHESDLDHIFDVIRATFEALKKNPFLYILPIIAGWIAYFVFWFFTWGLVAMLSAGRTQDFRIHVNGVQFAGLSRMFYMEWWRWIFIALWVLGGIWALHFVQMFHQYVITSVFMKWYWVPKERANNFDDHEMPSHPFSGRVTDYTKPGKPSFVFEGMLEAGFFHLGSLHIGSFLRTVYPPVLRRAVVEDATGFRDAAEITYPKDALMDVVVRANDFVSGWNGADLRLAQTNSKAVYTLKHKFYEFTRLAVLYAMTIAVIIAWLMVRNIDTFSTPGSLNYVFSPLLISLWAAILAMMVCYDVMALIDVGADALLGAYGWNKKGNKKVIDKYIPVNLRYCVGWEELKSDKYPYYGKENRNMYLNTFLNAPVDENPGIGESAGTHFQQTYTSMRNFGTGMGTRGGGGAGLGMS